MIKETLKHEIRWMCLYCEEEQNYFDDIVDHVFLIHDEFVKSKPAYYITKIRHCKKCTFNTEEDKKFLEHWKNYHE